ncbi:MAG: DUF4230 domain-containing protein [Verrucomicrobiae bacterium]|nr:DUF4230 domain-containing protein [Verrucomicrobiae bacterium]
MHDAPLIPPNPMNRRWMWMAFGGAATLAPLAALLLGVYLGRLVPGGRPAIANTATVITQIQSLSHLVTVKYVFEKVVVIEDAKWYGQNRLLMVAHGVAKAGVDLRNLDSGGVKVRGTRLWLTLPRPELTDVYLDEGKTEILERSTGLLRFFDQQMEQDARRQAIEAIRQAARASGIRKDAEDRARLQLMALARAAGFEEIYIEFR